MGHTWGGQPQDDNKVNCRLGNVRCAPFVMYMSDNVSIVLRNKHIMKYPTIWEYIGPLIFSTQLDILSKMSQIVVLITCYPFILCCLNYILSYHPISFQRAKCLLWRRPRWDSRGAGPGSITRIYAHFICKWRAEKMGQIWRVFDAHSTRARHMKMTRRFLGENLDAYDAHMTRVPNF